MGDLYYTTYLLVRVRPGDGTMNNQVFTTLSLFQRRHTVNNDSIDLMTPRFSFLVESLLLQSDSLTGSRMFDVNYIYSCHSI